MLIRRNLFYLLILWTGFLVYESFLEFEGVFDRMFLYRLLENSHIRPICHFLIVEHLFWTLSAGICCYFWPYISSVLIIFLSEMGFDPILEYVGLDYATREYSVDYSQVPDLEPIENGGVCFDDEQDPEEFTIDREDIVVKREHGYNLRSRSNKKSKAKQKQHLLQQAPSGMGKRERRRLRQQQERESAKPDGWLVYDPVFGLVPKEIIDRWEQNAPNSNMNSKFSTNSCRDIPPVRSFNNADSPPPQFVS